MSDPHRGQVFMTLGLAMALLLAGAGWAFQQGRVFVPPEDDESDTPDTQPPPSQFEFAWTRLAYDSPGYLFNRNRNSWTTDYPKADRQFLQGVLRYTRLHARQRETVVRPSDSQLF